MTQREQAFVGCADQRQHYVAARRKTGCACAQDDTLRVCVKLYLIIYLLSNIYYLLSDSVTFQFSVELVFAAAGQGVDQRMKTRRVVVVDGVTQLVDYHVVAQVRRQ